MGLIIFARLVKRNPAERGAIISKIKHSSKYASAFGKKI
jgi:hypothetical protein